MNNDVSPQCSNYLLLGLHGRMPMRIWMPAQAQSCVRSWVVTNIKGAGRHPHTEGNADSSDNTDTGLIWRRKSWTTLEWLNSECLLSI